MLRDQEGNDEHPQGVFGGRVQNDLQRLNQALYIPTWNNKLWKNKKKVPFFPSLFYLLGFVLQFLFLILFFLKKWISSKKSGFLSLLLKISPYKIMANFLPHELTDKKFFFIIDARKLLVYVSHNYKNLVFGDYYFHNS